MSVLWAASGCVCRDIDVAVDNWFSLVKHSKDDATGLGLATINLIWDLCNMYACLSHVCGMPTTFALLHKQCDQKYINEMSFCLLYI